MLIFASLYSQFLSLTIVCNKLFVIPSPYLDKYYFNPNRYRKSGFCSIIVMKADESHMGQWTCGARLIGRDYESIDEFRITVFNALAGTNAIMIAVIGVIVVLIFIVYSAQMKQNYRNPSRSFVAAYNTARNSLSIAFGSDSSSDGGSGRSSVIFSSNTPRELPISENIELRNISRSIGNEHL